jgi:hypothetical protein
MVFRNPFRRKGAVEEAPPDPVATGPATGETGSAERVLRRLEWSVIRRLDGLLQGDYRTLMRGAGLDLADLREYQHHDDVRHIDWNVTARLQVPHVRVFTEDREMAAWFLLDLSPSMDFGSHDQRKQGVAAEFVAVLARLLTRHGNRVGALLYGTGVDTVIPARGGRRHVLHLLHTMQHRPAREGRHHHPLHELLTAAGNVVRRRSTVFVVSDFISEPGWEKPLAQLALRHEVVAVRLHDPLELELPDLGLIPVRDAETGEQLLVDTSDPAFASASRASPRSARPTCGPRWRTRGWTRWSFPPTATWWTPSCASPTCAASARAGARAAPCRATCTRRPEQAHQGPQGLDHDLPLAPIPLAAAGPALAGAAVPVAAAPAQGAGGALRQLSIVKEAMGKGPGIRRHIPPVLFLLALAAMLLAAARPFAVVTLPSQHQTIILAMDVSGSMRATDVKPNRWWPRRRRPRPSWPGCRATCGWGSSLCRHGAGGAGAHRQPRRRGGRHRPLPDAARHRHRQRLILSLATLFPDQGIDLSQITGSARDARHRRTGQGPKKPFTPVEPGSYTRPPSSC